MSAPAQVPPADELAAVRAQRKALEQREAELKQLLISDPAARTGNHYLAEVREFVKQQPDYTELRKMYPKLVAEYTFPRTEVRVELAAIDAETGEIIGLRRAERIALKTMRIV